MEEEILNNEENSGTVDVNGLLNTNARLYQENAKLKEAVQQLSNRREEVQIGLSFRRLDFCFKVLEHAHMFSDKIFVTNITAEIQEALTNKEEGE